MHKQFLLKLTTATAASLLSVWLTAPAQAASFNFSYLDETTGDVLAGSLEGDIQNESDIVQVSMIGTTTVNGSTRPDITFVDSVSDDQGLSVNAPPLISFSGQTMNLLACVSINNSPCFEGFAFDTSGIFLNEPSFARSPVFTTSTSGPVPFDVANWSLAAQTPPKSVPEPSSAISLLGIVGLWMTLQNKAYKNRTQQA